MIGIAFLTYYEGTHLMRACHTDRPRPPNTHSSHLPDDALEASLVPLDGLDLGDSVRSTNPRSRPATLGDALTWPGPALY